MKGGHIDGTTVVRLLGRPRVESPAGRAPRGLKSWAVLARIALTERPVPRAQLAVELFADATDPMGALRWCLADLRRCLGKPELFRGDPLLLPDGALWVDARSLRAGALAVEDLGGLLLEGVDVKHCPRFDTWLLLTRGECAARSMQELREAALRELAAGDAETAAVTAGRAACLEPLDEDAQELFLRALVAAGHPARAAAHLARCEETYAREGLRLAEATRAAARPPVTAAGAGIHARAVAAALLRAGTAELDAGSADAGVETLRRAAEDAGRCGDPLLHGEVLHALGSALVHAVRGFDGEGAVVLHQALAAARVAAGSATQRPDGALDGPSGKIFADGSGRDDDVAVRAVDTETSRTGWGDAARTALAATVVEPAATVTAAGSGAPPEGTVTSARLGVLPSGAVVGGGAEAAARLTAGVLRELAFVDLQAGRHTVAERALAEAEALTAQAGDAALFAGVLGTRGMNCADVGRHDEAIVLLTTSAETADAAGDTRQAAWSRGILARSLLLSGRTGEALAAAEASVAGCDRERWVAFRPWPQSLRAHCLLGLGRLDEAQRDAEEAFALACELGDPCWEGMAGRALALTALRAGDLDAAQRWIGDARRRCDRVSDRYVWVSGFLALAELEIASRVRPDGVAALAARVRDHAVRHDLPEFLAWALVHQAEAARPRGAVAHTGSSVGGAEVTAAEEGDSGFLGAGNHPGAPVETDPRTGAGSPAGVPGRKRQRTASPARGGPPAGSAPPTQHALPTVNAPPEVNAAPAEDGLPSTGRPTGSGSPAGNRPLTSSTHPTQIGPPTGSTHPAGSGPPAGSGLASGRRRQTGVERSTASGRGTSSGVEAGGRTVTLAQAQFEGEGAAETDVRAALRGGAEADGAAAAARALVGGIADPLLRARIEAL